MEKKTYRLLFCLLFLVFGSSVVYAQKPQWVTVGNVTFQLSPDYKVAGRMNVHGGEAVLITPTDANDRNDCRLVLNVIPNALKDINGMTNEELHNMLRKYMDGVAGVFADTNKSGYKLDKPYKVHFDDNADGTYFPHCYCYLSWTKKDGVHQNSYSEVTLVNGTIITSASIATDEAELQGLISTFMDVVTSAGN